jgi:hypothetical protein
MVREYNLYVISTGLNEYDEICAQQIVELVTNVLVGMLMWPRVCDLIEGLYLIRRSRGVLSGGEPDSGICRVIH